MKQWADYFHTLGFEYTYLGVKHTKGEAAGDVKELEAIVSACTKCKLHAGRTQTVFGTGDIEARLVFVGEAPGADEDRQGEPFVGRAGQLLTRMIGAMGLSREQVYICNILKCRPPGNRDPEPEEADACIGYLIRQLELIQPEVIVALGRVSSQVLTGSAEPISKMRGHWYAYRGIPVMPTFHPSFLLRQPGKKREAWEDLQEVMRRLGLPLPASS
ncbi:MAG TPA: uracil-DNA glycosylase [Thermoanaerobaculia bacterium]|nr:uracil-DNA glycosylase [Thermoanaerobaculia bacterium]HUM31269.1 uracil-DNA glycosylase [Thermoanaerobaculia bacterium]HXK69604.1 uracil-DNA glycosylase [Thermoanaerobaculia bacterium]